jgi:hypothetical protein
MTYALFESDGITSATLPSYIHLTYPTLTIGSTSAGEISTTPQIVYTYKVKSTISITSVSAMATLTITINNECSTATISPNTIGNSYTYQLM